MNCPTALLSTLLLLPVAFSGNAFSDNAAVGAERQYDVVIYGGTSAGIAAAVQSRRMGKTVVVIAPEKHLGGLTAGGLGLTDSGNKAVVGGIAREYYQRIKKHYDQASAWKHERAADYGRYRPKDDAMWTFEPHVAEQLYEQYVAEYKILVVRARLARPGGAMLTRSRPWRIIGIRTESGETFRGKMFIDATYEGDLMAAAGVSFTVGREPNSQYGETLNGIEKKLNRHQHLFVKQVDPYIRPGDKASGLLPGIEAGPHPQDGEGDHRIQAYCFRLCMSNVAANRVPFAKPDGYDAAEHELLLRNFEAGDMRIPISPDMMPNGKTDTNNKFAVSSDYIGQNYSYPTASYAEREAIIKRHEIYQKGLMWTLVNHPRVPAKVRQEMSQWGLAADEFVDNGNWPHQIYVRESRRMVGDYVATENDCRRRRKTPASVGMGSYNMDSHNCMRYVTDDGFVQNEGDIQESPGGSYSISYLSIVPKRQECSNLLVPVCLSSSHIAYGSIRMEPVFMVLGQSAATAAALAIDGQTSVQAVDYEQLKTRLLKDGQVLQYDRPTAQRKPGISLASLGGIVIDDAKATGIVGWVPSGSVGGYVGAEYRHDNNIGKGQMRVTYQTDPLPAGIYDIRISYTPNPNRATNVPVTVSSAAGRSKVLVNQRKRPPIDGVWLSLGKFQTAAGKVTITVSNANTDGYVIADAVQLLRVDK